MDGPEGRLMDRASLTRAVSSAVGDRQLVFFGTRGDDAEGVADLPALAAVFSLIAAHAGRSGITSGSLEQLTGRRVDLDTYDIDRELHRAEIVELRRQILRVLARPSVVFTYRPSTFLSAICFAREHCRYAGLFAGYQAAFEHKPWVESAMRAMGIAAIPWTYVADEDQLETLHYLDEGPVVLRRSRSNGGTGLTRIDSAAQLRDMWPEQEEAFVSVSSYIEGGVPANVSAVVWADGVTLHGVSVQLIGVPGLTSRPFGYCGNDFGAARDLEPVVVAQMDKVTRRIGSWLGSHGYRGAFGVDFLIDGAQALFTEVNPRLQGVTHLACQLAVASDHSCVLLEHLAANLDLKRPEHSLSLERQVAASPDTAHMVIHLTSSEEVPFDGQELVGRMLEWPHVRRVDAVCPAGVQPEPGATLARVTIDERLTDTGFALAPQWASRVSSLTSEVAA